jgi:hypothetical protein
MALVKIINPNITGVDVGAEVGFGIINLLLLSVSCILIAALPPASRVELNIFLNILS